MSEIAKIVRGNAFSIRVKVRAYRIDGTEVEGFTLSTEDTLLLVVNNTVRRLDFTVEDDNNAIIDFGGGLQPGYYGIDFSGSFDDEDWRWSAKNVFQIVELTAQGSLPTDGILHDDTHDVDASVTLALLGPQADWAETDENSQAFIKNKPDVDAIDQRVEDIESVIPADASSSNKLADKDYIDGLLANKQDALTQLEGNPVQIEGNEIKLKNALGDTIFGIDVSDDDEAWERGGESEIPTTATAKKHINEKQDKLNYYTEGTDSAKIDTGSAHVKVFEDDGGTVEVEATHTDIHDEDYNSQIVVGSGVQVNTQNDSVFTYNNKEVATKEAATAIAQGMILDSQEAFNEHDKAPSGYAASAMFAFKSELVTSISSSSDDAHYPSAKAVYDFIMSGSATIAISTQYNGSSITNIFANTEYQLTVKATTSIEANSIVLKRGSATIKTATNVTTTSKTDTVQLSGGGTVSFSAVANINGIEKSASKTIRAYDKVFWGIGTENDYSTVATDSKVRTSIAGTYNFSFSQGTPYIYILVPTTMNDLDKAEMGAGGMGGYNLTKITDNGTLEANPGVFYRVWRGVAAITDDIQLIIS